MCVDVQEQFFVVVQRNFALLSLFSSLPHTNYIANLYLTGSAYRHRAFNDTIQWQYKRDQLCVNWMEDGERIKSLYFAQQTLQAISNLYLYLLKMRIWCTMISEENKLAAG